MKYICRYNLFISLSFGLFSLMILLWRHWLILLKSDVIDASFSEFINFQSYVCDDVIAENVLMMTSLEQMSPR